MANFAIVPRYVRANPDVRTTVPLWPAPRVPAGRHSLAAVASTPARRTLLGAIAMLPALIAPAFPLTATTDRTCWNAALHDYLAKKAYSDVLPMDDEDASDAAVDAYCDAMEHLAVDVRAPDLDALAYKIGLAKDRWQYVGVPNEWLDGFLADLRHLTSEGR